VSELLQEDDGPSDRCESGRKKPTKAKVLDSDFDDSKEEKKQALADLMDGEAKKKFQERVTNKDPQKKGGDSV